MNLKVLLPFHVFADKQEVVRVVAETADGSFGLAGTAWRRLRPGS